MRGLKEDAAREVGEKIAIKRKGKKVNYIDEGNLEAVIHVLFTCCLIVALHFT